MVIKKKASANLKNDQSALGRWVLAPDLSNQLVSVASVVSVVPMVLLVCLSTLCIWGCTGLTRRPEKMTPDQGTALETIVDTRTGRRISFAELMQDLNQVRIVYVGEQHTNARHHEIQLEIIRALAAQRLTMDIGMEMFSRDYQSKLDLWTNSQWTWEEFLKQVHWYANWKYPADLYKDILDYIRSRQLQLVGLNIPFCLPPKIAIGGLASLSPDERAQLPKDIDTTRRAHRDYIATIFEEHHFKGKGEFESFYEAQCAWEDGMAQTIADQGNVEMMVVLVGNGHIVRKFGIPQRAYKRLALPFRTVYLATHEMTVTAADGDFIWTTTSPNNQRGNPHR